MVLNGKSPSRKNAEKGQVLQTKIHKSVCAPNNCLISQKFPAVQVPNYHCNSCILIVLEKGIITAANLVWRLNWKSFHFSDRTTKTLPYIEFFILKKKLKLRNWSIKTVIWPGVFYYWFFEKQEILNWKMCFIYLILNWKMFKMTSWVRRILILLSCKMKYSFQVTFPFYLSFAILLIDSSEWILNCFRMFYQFFSANNWPKKLVRNTWKPTFCPNFQLTMVY